MFPVLLILLPGILARLLMFTSTRLLNSYALDIDVSLTCITRGHLCICIYYSAVHFIDNKSVNVGAKYAGFEQNTAVICSFKKWVIIVQTDIVRLTKQLIQ